MSQSSNYIKTMMIIHLALIAGQIIFAIACLAIVGKMDIILNAGDDVFFFVVPALALSGMMGSSFVFKRQTEQAAAKSTLAEKLNGYRTALIIRYAMLEGPSLIGIIAYFLTGNLYYMFISGFIILFFFTIRPTVDKTIEDLKLDYNQKDAFLKP